MRYFAMSAMMILLVLVFAAGLVAPAVSQGVSNPTKSAVVLSAVSNNSQMVGTAGPRQLFEITALTTAAALMDVRLYDTATAPTCSSATGMKANYPVLSKADGGGFTITFGALGKTFNLGIGLCITGANANDDNTNATTGMNLNFTFK